MRYKKRDDEDLDQRKRKKSIPDSERIDQNKRVRDKSEEKYVSK